MQACPISDATRAYNCICESETIPQPKCSLVHLSTQPQLFNRKYSGRSTYRFLSTDLELAAVAAYKPQTNAGSNLKTALYQQYKLNITAEIYKLSVEKLKALSHGNKSAAAVGTGDSLSAADSALLKELKTLLGSMRSGPIGMPHDHSSISEHSKESGLRDSTNHILYTVVIVSVAGSAALLVGFFIGVFCTMQLMRTQAERDRSYSAFQGLFTT